MEEALEYMEDVLVRCGVWQPASGIAVCGLCSAVGLVTKRRSSWACIGNPKPERDTIEGTHAQETPAYQRRPATPPNQGAIHAASEDTTHTSNHTACHQCSRRRPARHPPRAQQVPSQRTHNFFVFAALLAFVGGLHGTKRRSSPSSHWWADVYRACVPLVLSCSIS